MNEFYNVAYVRRKVADGTFANNVFSYVGNAEKTALEQAQKQFYASISTYIDDPQYDYLAVYLIRSDGVIIEGRVFDHTV